MGRRERPLDAAEGPVAEFACALRKLRHEAGGLTYRAMASKEHYSAATLAQAAAGVRLPTLPVVLAYVRACEGDPEEWAERWQQALREADDANAASAEGDPPYLGLARFGVEDHDRFFGRDHLVDELVDLFVRREFVVVVGPSGSGKSSVTTHCARRATTPRPTPTICHRRQRSEPSAAARESSSPPANGAPTSPDSLTGRPARETTDTAGTGAAPAAGRGRRGGRRSW
ncbi:MULTISPECIES: nSTAND1 domain-containing NTPase [unclassified Streptomyces]|uniref:nSTAND1 domain-containing NTPase n=1 Tax=Streptomyces sp. NPDC055082 TaxID=3365718 RepID=UPI0037D80582